MHPIHTDVQLSLAILNPLVPWKTVRCIQRFGVEEVPSAGPVPSPRKTVRYIQTFGMIGVFLMRETTVSHNTSVGAAAISPSA